MGLFCFKTLSSGLEGSGSELAAGGSQEPRPGSPAGEESRTGHKKALLRQCFFMQ